MTKHIFSNFFHTHGLQKKENIDVQQICSSNNVTNLITKVPSTSAFKKLVHEIEMR